MEERVIATVVGKNRVGVLAEVTALIADMNGNIMDLSQKIVEDYFNVIMIVDISGLYKDFREFKEKLEELGNLNGYRVTVQHEKTFQYMHRV